VKTEETQQYIANIISHHKHRKQQQSMRNHPSVAASNFSKPSPYYPAAFQFGQSMMPPKVYHEYQQHQQHQQYQRDYIPLTDRMTLTKEVDKMAAANAFVPTMVTPTKSKKDKKKKDKKKKDKKEKERIRIWFHLQWWKRSQQSLQCGKGLRTQMTNTKIKEIIAQQS